MRDRKSRWKGDLDGADRMTGSTGWGNARCGRMVNRDKIADLPGRKSGGDGADKFRMQRGAGRFSLLNMFALAGDGGGDILPGIAALAVDEFYSQPDGEFRRRLPAGLQLGKFLLERGGVTFDGFLLQAGQNLLAGFQRLKLFLVVSGLAGRIVFFDAAHRDAGGNEGELPGFHIPLAGGTIGLFSQSGGNDQAAAHETKNLQAAEKIAPHAQRLAHGAIMLLPGEVPGGEVVILEKSDGDAGGESVKAREGTKRT